jgi:hypothetical protein
MRQLTLRSRISVLIVCLAFPAFLLLGCRPSEPLPDHLGIFAVVAGEVHELPRQGGDPSTYDGFWALFSPNSVLAGRPDYLILYDPKFSPGDLRLASLTPSWFGGRFNLQTQEIPLTIEPVEKPTGMYRLRPRLPFTGSFYFILGDGPTSTGGGYRVAFCPSDISARHAEIQKIKDDEASRVKAATTPTKTLLQSRIIWPYRVWGTLQHPPSFDWDVTVTDTNLSWTGHTDAVISYGELQRVDVVKQLGPLGLVSCLIAPPRQRDCYNAVQAMAFTPVEEVKLNTIGKAAQAALAAWRQKYPNGIPYAQPVSGPR